MKIKINNLEQLEQFISDETITPKSKFTVFIEAMRQFKIMMISFSRGSEAMDRKAIETMLRIIESIKDDPEKTYHGTLLVRWNNPYARLIKAKKE